MSPERIWYGTDAAAVALRTAMLPLSGLYWIGWQTYLGTYKVGLKKAKEPHRPVICVGNMTVGGSGKSPTTIFIAKTLQSLGRQVVISASGYGSPASEAATLAPEGELMASRWGDEPAMLRWLLPDVPLIVGRRRVEAGRLCHEHFPDAVLLMDDGLQHMPLRKHVTIALDEAGANRFVLPAGPYREPRMNLKRVDLVLGAERAMQTEYGEVKLEPDLPAGCEVSVLSSIARPERLKGSLTKWQVVATRFLPDHDPLTAGNLFEGLPPDLPMIVTAKDWVKLRERKDIAERTIVVAHREARITPENAFTDWLKSKLDEQA